MYAKNILSSRATQNKAVGPHLAHRPQFANSCATVNSKDIKKKKPYKEMLSWVPYTHITHIPCEK